MITLTVSDIERLAKSGVAMSIGEVHPITDPLPPTEELHQDIFPSPMAEAIWDRWKRSKYGMTGTHIHGFSMPFQLLASPHGDKVWVSVHPTNFNYEPFQLQDDAPIYPSDALMAKLALWEANHK